MFTICKVAHDEQEWEWSLRFLEKHGYSPLAYGPEDARYIKGSYIIHIFRCYGENGGC